MKQRSVKFTDDLEVTQALTMGVFGPDGSGKSKLIGTMPCRPGTDDRIGLVITDPKTRWTLKDEIERTGKLVKLPSDDLVRSSNLGLLLLRGGTEEADRKIKAEYREHLDRVKNAVHEILSDNDVTSVALDSATTVYSDVYHAHFGRDTQILATSRGQADREFEQIITACTSSGKHCLFTFQESEVWVNGKPDVNGKKTWKGYSRMGYLVGAMLHLQVNRDEAEPDERYKAYVIRCQHAPREEARGNNGEELLTGESIRWSILAASLWPNVQGVEDWD